MVYKRHAGAALIAVVLMVTGMITCPQLAQAATSATDLGTLGGSSSEAHGINGAGQVVGGAATAAGGYHAFLWTDGLMRDLGTLGGIFSLATAINDKGQVVGTSTTAAGEYHAFLWTDGVMADLGTLGGTGFVDHPTSNAEAVNNRTQVVGQSTIPDYAEFRGFLWQGGQMTNLGTLGANYSNAAGINNSGDAVGYSATLSGHHIRNTRAFLWRRGTMTDLGVLGSSYGPGESTASAINDRGQVVGTSSTAHGYGAAFVWENGRMRELGDFVATALNDRGSVVGYSDQRAVLWEKGVTTDLGTAGGVASRAVGVNDSGQVVGWRTTGSGESRAVLWKVTP